MGLGRRSTTLLRYLLTEVASALGIGLLHVGLALQYVAFALWCAGLLAADFGMGAGWKRFERQATGAGGG